MRHVRILLDRRVLLACVAVLGMGASANAVPFYFEDFDGGGAGYTPTSVYGTPPPPTPAPWSYGAGVGVAGSGGWKAPGGEGIDFPFQELLTSPPIVVPGPGHVILDFDHMYDFEEDWDGGTLMINVNSGGFVHVPASAFTANGYTGTIQSDPGSIWEMSGLDVFDASSGGFLHSTADLGEFQAGDTLEVQFRGGWDWYYVPSDIGWTVDNVGLSLPPGEVIPEPVTLALLGLGAAGLGGYIRRRRAA